MRVHYTYDRGKTATRKQKLHFHCITLFKHIVDPDTSLE
jgi:hypothetical protein